MAKLFLVLALVACAYAQNYDAEFASYDVLMNTCDMNACRNGLKLNSEDCWGCLFDCGGQQFDDDMDKVIFAETGPCADMGACAVRCGTDAKCMRNSCCGMAQANQCDQLICNSVPGQCVGQCMSRCQR